MNKYLEKRIQRKMMNRSKMIRNTEYDSGYDLYTIGYSRVIDGKVGSQIWFDDEFSSVNVYPGQRILLSTGISIKLPAKRPNVELLEDGSIDTIGNFVMEGQIRPRSGLSLKSKTNVKIGTIDNSYVGNIGIIFENVGQEVYVVNDLDRIAQLVFQEVYVPTEGKGIIDVEALDDTDRGSTGFGDSGIRGGKDD